MGPIESLVADVGAFNWLWGYFIPLGMLMLLWGSLSPQRARRVTPIAAMSVALATLGYWAVGFALHLGGAYAVTQDAALQGLQRMFPIVPNDANWGIVGLAGFFLAGEQMSSAVFALFLAYLPLMATAVLLVTLALAQTRRWIMVTAGALTGTVIVPVAACWSWGSGWLAHLGQTLGLARGFVDFGGASLILWLPGMIALPILLLQPRADHGASPPPPPNHAPLVANVGALLLGIGWLGWGLSHPFHVSGAILDWHRTAVNVLLGMGGAVITAQLYAWLALGAPEAPLASQGLAAGWGAVLACAPFVLPWAAVIIGLLAGLIFPLLHYAIRAAARIHDAGPTIALAVTSGPLGLLSVGILADGRWGQGWNRMGLTPEGMVTGPGIAGIFVTGSAQQLTAQVVGLVAFGVWGLLWGVVLGVIASPDWLGRIARVHRKALESSSTEDTSIPDPGSGASLEDDTPQEEA